MDIRKINEIMASRGYSNFVGTIFKDWEFVKDEILLPNRKIGSGNGTSHIYLLEDNMTIFRKCFKKYLEAFSYNVTQSEDQCPRITHYVMTANILTVAGFAYCYYQYDSNIFNYSDYVNKVMQYDNNGLVEFESLFKLSTDNRPYFKQFDKLVFGKIIRYLFVPQLSAYKIYLYRDDSCQNYAAFWIIGQIQKSPFVINKENIKGDIIPIESQKQLQRSRIIRRSAKITEADFIDFMRGAGKSKKTIESYLLYLKSRLPQKIKKEFNEYQIDTLLEIDNLEILKSLDLCLWNNPRIREWNISSHNAASAALHMYINYIKDASDYIVTESTMIYNKSSMGNQETLTNIEEAQKKQFVMYLKKIKSMSDITINSYVSVLQKHMTELISGEGYLPYKANFFSIKDYQTLIKINDHVWMNSTIHINHTVKKRLSAAYKAYMDFIESQLSDEELAEIVFTQRK